MNISPPVARRVHPGVALAPHSEPPMLMDMLADCREESMVAATTDLDDATASLAAFYANVRAAGRPGLSDAIPAILAQLRGIGREMEDGAGDVGEPSSDWYLAN